VASLSAVTRPKVFAIPRASSNGFFALSRFNSSPSAQRGYAPSHRVGHADAAARNNRPMQQSSTTIGLALSNLFLRRCHPLSRAREYFAYYAPARIPL
jgi:hypothetical protein